MMTKVGQLFEEEKIEYGKEIERKVTKNVTEKVTQKVTKRVTKRKELEFTEKMLRAGLSVQEVSGMMSVLTEKEVQKIAGRVIS